MRAIGAAFLLFAALFAAQGPALSQDQGSAQEPDAEDASPIVSVATVEPRGFGYFVGDLLTRKIAVTVAEPFKLDTASQPIPRHLSYWLDLKSVEVEESTRSGGTRYVITLVYQTLYVPLSSTPRSLPPLTLRFTDGAETVIADIPPFDFVMAPLREVQPERPKEGPAGYLRPDAAPYGISTRKDRIGVAAGLTIVLIALGLLAYHEARWPFRKRPARPFTQAARRLRRLSGAEDSGAYRSGLIDLHRAFDAAAGHRLLAEDVPAFVASRSEFQPFEAQIGRFFATSRRAFFGNDVTGAAKSMPLPAVAALGAELGAAERRAQ